MKTALLPSMSRSVLLVASVAAPASFALGCSDPVGEAPKGGIYFSIQGCQTFRAGVGKNGDAPDPIQAPPGENAPWPGTRLKDGEEGAAVSCRVSGSDLFTVNASFTGFATSGNNVGNKVSLNVSDGSIANDATGTASITLNEPGNVYQPASGVPCTLRTDEGKLQVGPGFIFAEFDCPDMQQSSNPSGSTCRGTGVFVFEHCSK